MSTAQVVAAAVVIGGALIALIASRLSDHYKTKDDNRKRGINAYSETRTAWDQAQIDEIVWAVRREKLQEVRRGLVEIKLLVGRDIQTPEFEELIALLDGRLTEAGADGLLAKAQTLWPKVEKQIHTTLIASR